MVLTRKYIRMKFKKASGLDNITNEYINCSIETMLPVYHKLFNKTLDSGILPETWLVGTILPVYKNNGDICNPENDRPITILSCLGKQFTSIRNSRLNYFLDSHDLLNKSQSGFRKNHSTLSHKQLFKPSTFQDPMERSHFSGLSYLVFGGGTYSRLLINSLSLTSDARLVISDKC